MTTPALGQQAENSFIKAEPVIAAHLAASVVGYVLALLVTHGVITHVQASALTQQVVPIVTSALVALLGVVVRRFVSPAAKFEARVQQAVAARLGALLEASSASPAAQDPMTAPPVVDDTAPAPAPAGP